MKTRNSASPSIRTSTSNSNHTYNRGTGRRPKTPKTAGVACSHAEFDALPYSVQRKYFSSLERLRIAEQQSLDDKHHHQQWLQTYPHLHDTSRRSSHSRSHSHSHSHAIGLHHRSLSLVSSRRRRLRKAESLRIQQDIAQQEVQFFLSLPPKLRKQHFSREEQLKLLRRCEEPPLPDPAIRERAQQRFTDFQFGLFDDQGSNPERGRSRRRSRSISPTRAAFDDTQDTPAHEPSLDIDTMSPPLSFQMAPPASSFRRTLSLTNIPVRHSTSSAPPLVDPPLRFFGPPQRHQRSTSLSQTGRRSSHTPGAPVFDPEATHYQDPEARKKLRTYLASPQKFDEAVEFGFPSAATGDDTITPRYQLPPITTDARNFSRDMQTFLRDDKMSFLEDNEDEDVTLETDGESVTDLDSPVTPSSAANMSFRGHARHVSPSTFSSLDSTGVSPVLPIQSRLNREMTLRMTLTRPDLRADEEQLYGWQAPKDPFALEELHLTDDMTGSKSPFAVKPKPQGNLVSRLFKRASRKGR